MIEVKINDRDVRQALNRLIAASGDLKPALREIGETLMVSTKRRFAEQRDPDGNPWETNKESTLLRYLENKAGRSVRRKGEVLVIKYYDKKRNYNTQKGKLNAAGARTLIAKKVLTGESKRLGHEINYRVTGGAVEVGSSLEYAATQQFGAKKGAFGKTKKGRDIPWGDIPARPFLGLSAKDKQDVLAILNEHLAKAMGGRS